MYKYSDLGTFGAENSIPLGLNNQGWVVGYSQVADAPFPYYPFLYRPGVGMERLSTSEGSAAGVNNAGVVVGHLISQPNSTQRGVVWAPGQPAQGTGRLGDSPSYTLPLAINESGQVVGWDSVDELGGIKDSFGLKQPASRM